MGSQKGSQMKPRVAVIGAGLTGLSAAYFLREKAQVTIFEKEARIGGRLFTDSVTGQEHGAQFILQRQSEPSIHKLIQRFGLELVEWKDWPGYEFGRHKAGHIAYGSPEDAAQDLLSPESAKRTKRLFKLIKEEAWGIPRGKFNQWISDRLMKDRQGVAFVDMLLAGETCAPANHVKAQYALECLSSLYDRWYSLRGGSGKLVEALCENSGAQIIQTADVSEVKEIRGCVRINWSEGYERKSENFTAAIIATPNGERLVGMPTRGHFHAYISVLLDYQHRPQLKAKPKFDLSGGLYTDGPLNYIQLTKRKNSCVLRILIPNGGMMIRWRELDLVAYCVHHLSPYIAGVDQFHASSVQKWKFGLPCGGYKTGKGFQRIGHRIFLAGDRFGKWPSMDAAISSGLAVGKAFTHEL